MHIVILGAGPGGYPAAVLAAKRGASVTIVEKDEHLGGVCLNRGCIPTKALLHAAESSSVAQNNAQDIFSYKNIAMSHLRNGLKGMMKSNKIKVVRGVGKILQNKQVSVTEMTTGELCNIKYDKLIIATGGRPKELPEITIDGSHILDSTSALNLTEIPESISIVGSGAIGIEFASFFRSCGAKVSVYENQERILPNEDREISTLARKLLEKRGIKFFVSCSISNLCTSADGVMITTDSESHRSSHALIAIGISPNSEGIGLEDLKIECNRGHIVTNEYCQTNVEDVYAIGDISSPPWLAHKAGNDAFVCTNHIFHNTKSIGPVTKSSHIPACTYSDPQIASIGITEEQAIRDKIDVKIGKSRFIGNGKAVAIGHHEGMVKLIFSKQHGEILGAHMIGHGVTELLHSIAIAMLAEATDVTLMETVLPHPTMSEAILEAALDANGSSVH